MRRNKDWLFLLIALSILCLPLSGILTGVTNFSRQPTPAPTATAIQAPIEVVLSKSNCTVHAEGVFSLHDNGLGCPFTGHPRTPPEAWPVQIVYQPFERGAMLWSSKSSCCNPPRIFVFYTDGSYQSYPSSMEDFYAPTSLFSRGEKPADDLFKPMPGFRKTWQEEPGIRDALGWATAEAIHSDGRFQPFQYGSMIWASQRQEVYILNESTYSVVNRPTFALPTPQPPGDSASLILNRWIESNFPPGLSAIVFLADGTIIIDDCPGNYQLFEGGKIHINADGCLSPALPTGVYEYTLDTAGQFLTLSQRYRRIGIGYSETTWRQEDNHYDIELSPAGIRIIGEDQCYGAIDTIANASAMINWSECRGGEKRLATARYKFTYVGRELFLTRQFERPGTVP